MQTTDDAGARIHALARMMVSDGPRGAELGLERFFADHGSTLNAVGESAAMRRLGGISQLGLKRGTRGVPALMVPFCGGEEGETVPLPAFSRRDHSEHVCATMLAVCLMYGVAEEDALHAAVGALCHDLGHPVFSHTSEPLLLRHGHDDHETVGLRMLEQNAELREAFVRGHVDASRVAAVIREEGDLGVRQKAVDTCAYLRHDARTAGFSFGRAFGTDFLRSLGEVRDGAFVSDDPFLIEQLLECRATMTAEFYEHPYNRLNSLFLRACVEWLVAERGLPLGAVAGGEDERVLAFLASNVPDAPEWVASARRFLLGRPREARRWSIVRHADEARAADAAGRGTPARPALLLPPIDMFGKRIPVRDRAGTLSSVRARTPRPDHHGAWYVVIYAGPV